MASLIASTGNWPSHALLVYQESKTLLHHDSHPLPPLPVTMYISISILFLTPLFATASSQGLTDAQIDIIKQRLQEGATYRSASLFFCICGRWLSEAPLASPETFVTLLRNYLCCCGRGLTLIHPKQHAVVLVLNETLPSPVGNSALAPKLSSSSLRPPSLSSRPPCGSPLLRL